jgi:hypothetical protein
VRKELTLQPTHREIKDDIAFGYLITHTNTLYRSTATAGLKQNQQTGSCFRFKEMT